MRDVSIIGIGQTKVGEHWEHSLRDLAVESILAALDDAHIDEVGALYVGNMLSGRASEQEHLAALIADYAGLSNVEAVKMEAACGSAGTALRMGYLAVASGAHDFVIAAGVEKMTDRANGEMTANLITAADADYEAAHGLTFVGLNALLMQRYMHTYGVSHDAFAGFTVNAHANAATNPNAMFQNKVTADAFRKARMIADPINLLDSSPMADGAAAVLLCPTDMARGLHHNPVRIRASAIATDSIAIQHRRDALWLEGAHMSAWRAYAQAGVTPDDIDVFELHDAFTIMAALSLEACGFAPSGQGVRLAEEGVITRQGRLPIATLGGLKGRGHPVGATGLYQIVELVQQLRGEAGPNQVDCRLGMAQNIGGSGATVTTHILEAWN